MSVGGLENAGLWRLPLAGDRLEKIPSQTEDGLAGLAWLDADTIAFTSCDGGTPQIWTMAADGSNRRQITIEGSNVSPRPTRDGRTIYFVATRQGRTGIWAMNRTGTSARQIAQAPELWDLVLSHDERQLLFTAPGPDRLDSTWVVSTDGGEPSLLVAGLTQAAVSPDGRAVAGFWKEGANAQPALAVFPMAGGGATSIFASAAVMPRGGVWWSRDGRALYYTGTDRANVWRQPLAGARRRR